MNFYSFIVNKHVIIQILPECNFRDISEEISNHFFILYRYILYVIFKFYFTFTQ